MKIARRPHEISITKPSRLRLLAFHRTYLPLYKVAVPATCRHWYRLLHRSYSCTTTRLSSVPIGITASLRMSTGAKRKATEPALDNAKKPKANGSITSFFGAPKTSSSTASSSTAPVVKFDKEKWAAKLTDEQRELLKLEIETLHESWLAHLHEDVLTPSFLELKRFLKRERESGAKIFPPEEDVYSWSVQLPCSCRR